MKVLSKKVIPVLLAVACAGSMFSACTKKETAKESNDEKISYTIAVRNSGTSLADLENDAQYKEFCEKFNIEFDVTELTPDTMGEKVRLMVASDTLTDVLHAPFDFTEYISYANQGLIAALPDDLETKYPNLAWAIKGTGIENSLRKTEDGKLYAIPRALSILEKSDKSDESNVKLDTYGFWYRKDWAKKLGIEVPEVVEYEEFMEIVKKLQKADFHENKDEIVGICMSFDEAPNLFVTAYNSYYNKFHKVDGKYIFGLDEPTTLEGLKEYKKAYAEGLLHPNFFAHKSADAIERFNAGKAAVYFGNVGSEAIFNNEINSFGNANPNIDATEAVGLAWIKSPDGKVHGREDSNQWTTWYLKPGMSEEKMDRILQVFDYIKSEEGFKEWNYGVEGIDYTKKDGEYELISWTKQEDGSYLQKNKYNFSTILSMMSAEEHQSVPFLKYSDNTREAVKALREAKQAEKLDLAMLDYDVQYFTGSKYRNFMGNFDVNTMMAEVVVSNGDIEKDWAAKMKGIRGILDPALKEINKELLGK